MGKRAVHHVAEEQKNDIQRGRDPPTCHAGDLDRFGLIPEFIGRLPVIAVMDDLGVDDLVQVLSQNSLVRQYEKLFKFEKVKLTFTDEALTAVAEKASTRKAGARGSGPSSRRSCSTSCLTSPARTTSARSSSRRV